MALQSADLFASFDVTAGAYTQDISPALVEAIYFDLNFLEAVPLGWDSPVFDTVHYWNEDSLNADTVTSNASISSGGTSLALTSGHGARCHIGDLLLPQGASQASSTEVLQITDISTDTLTLARTYNSTSAASYASGQVFTVIDAMQEGSDIGTDKSVAPTVRQNNTQILGTRDLRVSGTQLARRMATRELQDWVGHQLGNRAIELKRKLIYAVLYGEPSSSAVGSDSVYRTMEGVRSWARDTSGQTESTAAAIALTHLNSINKAIVDLGEYNDTLVVGTGLVSSLAAIDASNRRLYESDTAVGYTVQEILLDQGNTVRVVIDSRVNTADAFLIGKAKVMPKPMNGRGMFTIAATDFSDARKRRVLAEWTLEVHHPSTLGLITNKS
jgi:hypothetical protein